MGSQGHFAVLRFDEVSVGPLIVTCDGHHLLSVSGSTGAPNAACARLRISGPLSVAPLCSSGTSPGLFSGHDDQASAGAELLQSLTFQDGSFRHEPVFDEAPQRDE